ncbi:MAG: YidC/Oxa1 family insertase periplasmic-domain containing protein, partial [Acidobacteriota bacterium]|nr:YidC/Oxa1 family insertase periplasmic-domain containing protein [Acidobacteriota bacterium]
MDNKRLSLALLLTAAVVAVTPILFPTARRSPAPVTTRSDSVVAGATTTGNTPSTIGSTATTPAVASSSVAADSLSRDTTAGGDSAAAAGKPVQSEITAVVTNNSTYRFTNIGAAPVSVVMTGYRNLTPAGGLVELKSAGQQLLRYSVVTRGDTIALDRVPFVLTLADSTEGPRSLNYAAVADGLTIGISYAFVPNTYVVNVTGTIEGATGPTYLLADLPSTLPAAESDTLGDLRTLAYSFKPTRENASGVPFSKLEPGTQKLQPGPISWVAVRNKYFVLGLINPQGGVFNELMLKGGPRTSKTATNASATVVKSIAEGKFAFEMYAGPQQSTQLLA